LRREEAKPTMSCSRPSSRDSKAFFRDSEVRKEVDFSRSSSTRRALRGALAEETAELKAAAVSERRPM